MTNFLIPHTFVAGTKAKAEEVNANFTAVKTELETKALKTGDSTSTFSVADATASAHAVNKSQLDSAVAEINSDIDEINSRNTAFVPFCVVSGNVDAEGAPDLMSYELMEVSFKVGDTYANLVISSTDESKYEFTSIAAINMSGSADGDYNVFVSTEGGATALDNAIYVQKARPTLLTNDVWVDTSKEPVKAYSYDGTDDIAFNGVPIGKVTIASGAITAVETFPFNQNGYDVNVNYLNDNKDYREMVCNWGIPQYNAAGCVDISLSTTNYTVPYNALIMYTGYTARSYISLYVNELTVATWYNDAAPNPHTVSVFVKKGDIVRLSINPAYVKLSKMYKLRGV